LDNFTKKKFNNYSNLNVVNTKFEDFTYIKDSIDLVYSDTAFHWISEEIGYKKIYNMLKPNGTIGLFWNKPFANRMDDKLHMEIQSIYENYSFAFQRSSTLNTSLIEEDTERYNRNINAMDMYGFKDVTFKLYKSSRTLKFNEYISLLNTYSDHRAMDSKAKVNFE